MKPIIPLRESAKIANTATIMADISNLISANLQAIGLITAARPIASPALAELLPTMFPIIISGLPPLTRDVIASGAEEPMATMVSPTTKGVTPRRIASFFAPSTIASEPM